MLDELAIVNVLLKILAYLNHVKAHKGKKDVKFRGESAITRAKEEYIIEGEGHGETVGGYGNRYFGTRWGCPLGAAKAVVEAKNGLVIEDSSKTFRASLFYLFGEKEDHGYSNRLLPIRHAFPAFHLIEDAGDGK